MPLASWNAAGLFGTSKFSTAFSLLRRISNLLDRSTLSTVGTVSNVILQLLVLRKLAHYCIVVLRNWYFRYFAPTMSRFEFKGKSVLISGGGGAFGYAFARECVRRGCGLVILIDVNKDSLRECRKQLLVEAQTYTQDEDLSKRLVVIKADLGNTDSCARVCRFAKRELVRFHRSLQQSPLVKIRTRLIRENQISDGIHPDILFNNCAVAYKRPLDDISVSELVHSMHVNAVCHMTLTKYFLESMKQSAFPSRIVFVGSMMGRLGASHCTDYCAAKFALRGFAESLRSEIRMCGMQHKIAVGLVEPGVMDTPLFADSQIPSWMSQSVFPVVNHGKLAKEVADWCTFYGSADVGMSIRKAWQWGLLGMLNGNGDDITWPPIVNCIPWIRSLLPGPLFVWIGDALGLNSALGQ